jgi:hypothetical protein
MQLDAHGNALAGHGGPGWFLNGAAILAPPAGNDPVFWQGRALGNDGAALVSTDLAGGDRVILDARGCSRIYSDGAAWGAFLQDGATGVYTSWGLALPAGEAYGLAAGVLYGRPVFQSAGGLAAWAVGETDPARVLWTDPAAEVVEFAAHPTRPNAVIWTDGRRQLHAHGIAPPAQAEDCFAPRIVERRPGDLYLLEWREGVGLIVRPWADADHGWIVFGDVAWGAAARVDTAGRDTVEIAFSLNPAEAGDVHRATVSFAAPMVAFAPAPVEPPIDPPVEPIDPPIEPPDRPIDPPIEPPIDPIEPPKPEDRVMQISLASLQKFEDPETVTEVDHPDGHGYKALKTAAGKFKSVTPDGRWDADKDHPGAWETWTPQGGGIYLHYVGEQNATYSVSCITADTPHAGKAATK